MRNIEKILNSILTLILVLIVICQGINIKDLQEKVDYLFDEIYFIGDVIYDTEMDYYIDHPTEKGGEG